MPLNACKKVGKGLFDYKQLYKLLLGISLPYGIKFGEEFSLFFFPFIGYHVSLFLKDA